MRAPHRAHFFKNFGAHKRTHLRAPFSCAEARPKILAAHESWVIEGAHFPSSVIHSSIHPLPIHPRSGAAIMETGYVRKWGTADRNDDDPLGSEYVRKIVGAIRADVGDPLMHPSIPTNVARALWERRLSIDEVAELCDIVRTKRLAKELESPGAYFVASIKRMFQRNDIPWRQPKRG
jgi:hypothetical protein